MIFGWLEEGTTDRWVLVDAVFPWPALHNGRNAIRQWADYQNRLRVVELTAGPRRCPWPCKTAVKENGSAELRIWPCEPYGKPRRWSKADGVWRLALTELAELVATDINCSVELAWMGGDVVERAVSPPGLRDRGFLCWGKGEREPRKVVEPPSDLKFKVTGMNMRIMPDSQDSWHGVRTQEVV